MANIPNGVTYIPEIKKTDDVEETKPKKEKKEIEDLRNTEFDFFELPEYINEQLDEDDQNKLNIVRNEYKEKFVDDLDCKTKYTNKFLRAIVICLREQLIYRNKCRKLKEVEENAKEEVKQKKEKKAKKSKKRAKKDDSSDSD